MKRTISFIAAALCLILCLGACASPANEQPTSAASASETAEKASSPSPSGQTSAPDAQSSDPAVSDEPTPAQSPSTAPTDLTPAPGDDPIDMEAFLTALISDHPTADAEALCAEMLKSPYFALFEKQSLSFYWPYLEFGFKPSGIAGAYGVMDASDSFVGIVIPSEGTDPESVVKELEEHLSKEDYEGSPDATLLKEIGGKVVLAIYHSDMRPIRAYAQKGRDFVSMFRDYLSAHPDAGCLEMAKFFASRQKLGRMGAYQAEEGELRGFGVWDEGIGWYMPVEISGFADGARFEPMMEPNAFMGYVFRLKEGVDQSAFVKTLRDNANLAYNVCTSVNTVITETEGGYVLFMMCNES